VTVPRGRAGLWRRLLRVSLFTKVIVANGVLAAAVGGGMARAAGRRRPAAPEAPYATPALLALGGSALSLAANALVLRTALLPLARLERTARRVQAGDPHARVRPGAIGDPDTDRLAATFNDMLDGLRDQTRLAEAYAARLRALSDRVLVAQEEERERLAGRLLDDTGQLLATLLLELRLFQNAAAAPGAEPGALGRQAAAAAGLARETLDGVRRLAQELRPRLLDDLGLVAAVEDWAREWAARSGTPVQVQAAIPADVHLEPLVGVAVYRTVQEALANVAAHASARHVEIALGLTEEALVVEVADDGRGMPAGLRPGLGLFGMQERLGLVGGRLAVHSAPGQGTTVRAVIPLPAEAGAAGHADDLQVRLGLDEPSMNNEQAQAGAQHGEVVG
jgi:two-component system sensor histidine kinase UhpB